MSVFPEGSVERQLEEVLHVHAAGLKVRQECRCGAAPGHLTLAEHQAEMVAEALNNPTPPWLERERAQWQHVINDWADAYAKQGRELDALKASAT